MEKVSVDDVESDSFGSGIDRRGLSGPLGTTEVAINRYRLAPDERISGLHAHMDQEEIFIVIEGEATFETLHGEVTVGEGEAIRFGPGEFQSGKNDSGSELAVYALGAPRNTEEIRIPLECPNCGHDNMSPSLKDGKEALLCPDCGAESEVECPECGNNNMRAVLDESKEKPTSVCLDCGAESEP